MTLKVTVLEQEVDRLSSDGELENVSVPKKYKGKGAVEEVTEAAPTAKEAFLPMSAQILILTLCHQCIEALGVPKKGYIFHHLRFFFHLHLTS